MKRTLGPPPSSIPSPRRSFSLVQSCCLLSAPSTPLPPRVLAPHPTPSSQRIPVAGFLRPRTHPPAAAFPVELSLPSSLPASPALSSTESSGRQVQIGGFAMAGSEDVKGLAATLGELHVEASPSREERTDWHGNGEDAAADDDSWCDASDSPGHDSSLHREWTHRQDQFRKMGYRDGITEGQKDVAQEGFNLGHRQSAHIGYKWGLVRGITSALASLPDSLKEKLLLDAQRRGKLEDLHKSVREISAEGALRLFHESILQDNHQAEESKLQTIPRDLLLLLHECPDVHVSDKLKPVP